MSRLKNFYRQKREEFVILSLGSENRTLVTKEKEKVFKNYTNSLSHATCILFGRKPSSQCRLTLFAYYETEPIVSYNIHLIISSSSIIIILKILKQELRFSKNRSMNFSLFLKRTFMMWFR